MKKLTKFEHLREILGEEEKRKSARKKLKRGKERKLIREIQDKVQKLQNIRTDRQKRKEVLGYISKIEQQLQENEP